MGGFRGIVAADVEKVAHVVFFKHLEDGRKVRVARRGGEVLGEV